MPPTPKEKKNKSGSENKSKLNGNSLVSEMINQMATRVRTNAFAKKERITFSGDLQTHLSSRRFRSSAQPGRVRKFDLREIFICGVCVSACVATWVKYGKVMKLCFRFAGLTVGRCDEWFFFFFSFRISFSFVGKAVCERVFSSSVVNWHFATAAFRERGKRKDTFLCVCKQPQPG